MFVRGLRITEYNAITTRAKCRSDHGIEVTVPRVKVFPKTRIQGPNHADLWISRSCMRNASLYKLDGQCGAVTYKMSCFDV